MAKLVKVCPKCSKINVKKLKEKLGRRKCSYGLRRSLQEMIDFYYFRKNKWSIYNDRDRRRIY